MSKDSKPGLKIITRGHGVYTDDAGKAHRYDELETDDGRRWREALGPELAPDKLDNDTLVWFGRGMPHRAGEFADYVFPGGHPYLHGLCMLGPPVYIEQKCPVCGASPCETYNRGGHRPQYCWCGKVLPDENCARWHSAAEDVCGHELPADKEATS